MIITVPTTTWSVLVICTTSEVGLPKAHYRLKGAMVIGGITAKWHMELTMQDTVCTGILPNGGGIHAYLGSNVFNVDNQKMAGIKRQSLSISLSIEAVDT
jgi:hypothetical protein